MKIYIIVCWNDEKFQTHPAIISSTSKKDAIRIAKTFEEMYSELKYPRRKIIIRCDEGIVSTFIEWQGGK